jgi:hypothetical protein
MFADRAARYPVHNGPPARVNRPNAEKESPVDSTVTVLVVVIVVLVLALAAAAVLLYRRRRTERLQEHYGPEYERSLDQAGNRREAEARLTEREKRHRKLDIRDLRPEERDRFATSWEGIQREFVDDPQRAVHDADVLVLDIMRTRGYPVGDGGDDFERRAEDISVEHPEVVQRYRDAHAVRDATAGGDVDTEQQRSAVTSYRSLVDALLNGDRRDDPNRGDRTRDDQSRDDQSRDDRTGDDRTGDASTHDTSTDDSTTTSREWTAR